MKSVLDNFMGVVAMICLVVHTLIIGVFVFFFIFWRLVLPESISRKYVNPSIIVVANVWLAAILWWMKHVQRIQWDVNSEIELSKEQWYMVVSNHQSWVDIFALFQATKGKIPLLKFFIKKELMKVPIVGQAWWAMDYPFMQRHSPAYISKYPSRANDDLIATRKACEKFSHMPTSIVNFLEGTRYSVDKQKRQKAPYDNLLRPKPAGIAFAIQALGQRFSHVLDTTIVYEGEPPTFWDLACGRVKKVTLRMRHVEIPEKFMKMDYQNNREDKKDFQKWLHELWLEKDAQINSLKAS